MLHYILQTIAFQLFFLLAYDVFLKKETFFKWNRIYLLATSLLSLILPFIKVNSFKEVIPQNYIISLPEIVLGQPLANPDNTIALNTIFLEENSLSLLELIFYIGVCVTCGLFLFKVFKILVLILKNPKQSVGNVVLVELINSNAAFSFFHYIFLGEHIKSEDKETILKHELIHTQQKHTIDLLFFEVLRILFWFNPFVYMYQTRMAILHEFIADANVVKHQNKEDYYQNLLAQVFETKNISFINTFFKQSLIKKRIVMLSKTKSKQIHLFKYALLIPMVLGMLVYTSCDKEITSEEVNNELSDEQLKEKLREELNKMKADNADFFTISEAFMIKTDKYIYTKEEYYRLNIYVEDVIGMSLSSMVKNAEHRNYTEYLEWKKTDKAKEIWENNTHDGILKLVVNDLKNLTRAEQEKYNKKKELLLKDDFFAKFIMTDGKTKVVIGETESVIKTKDSDSYNDSNNVEVPFAIIDNVPVFPGCEGLASNSEKKKCMAKNISELVAKNFNTKLAEDLNLKGRQRISVIFKVDKMGYIKGIRARAPHPALEEEAKRVISLLPKMKPGMQEGKAVTVPYSLPIVFQVNE